MNKPNLNIIINDDRWEELLPNAHVFCLQILEKAISFVQQHDPSELFEYTIPHSINLCLSNNDEVQKLNNEFRNKDKPTNVLSFANIDDPEFRISADDPIIDLGDIIIALDTVQSESIQKSIPFNHHFSHLFVHGILHLLGYDHIEDDEADYMEQMETKILQIFNIPNPYQE